MKKILVIEDDKNLRQVVFEYLTEAGFSVVYAKNGMDGLSLLDEGGIDLVILDIMLPGLSGLDVLRTLRETSKVPVMMLTALTDENTQLASFTWKADDYVTKPFSPKILVQRVIALLRRVYPTEDNIIIIGEVVIDKTSYRVTVNGENITLTTKEFDLLYILAAQPNQVVTRTQLLDKVWGYDYFGDDRIIDAHMRNLRKKLDCNFITTVKGVGYRLEKPL